MKVAGALAIALLLPSATGQAATRAFAETYETRTGAEGDAQLETWIDNESDFGHFSVWRFWWGGSAALTDALEVSVYLLGAQQRAGSATAPNPPGGDDVNATTGLQLEKIELMGRYRLVGDGLSGFSAMLQLEVGIPLLPSVADQGDYFDLNHATDVSLRLIAAYDAPHFVAAANLLLTGQAILNAASNYDVTAYAKYAAGAAWAPLHPGLRGPPLTLGLEVFGDLSFTRDGVWSVWWPGDFPVAVGPAVSYARGRFWATASYGYAPVGALSGVDAAKNKVYDGKEGVGRLIVAFEF